VIAVVDYGMGNLRSVLNALDAIDASARLVSSADQLDGAEKVVLPGVGAFGDGMRNLSERGFPEALRRHVDEGRPLLGICLGMQLLATRGYEHGLHDGLGLVPGEVRRIETDATLRVPHVGWNELAVKRDSPLLAGLDETPMFYFVHSYAFVPDDPNVVTATTDYGSPISATVQRGPIHGVQFHPEKSQRSGLRLLNNFAAL
jgi:glutamine amidotransferase